MITIHEQQVQLKSESRSLSKGTQTSKNESLRLTFSQQLGIFPR